jgi:hypothetical protein
MFPHFNILREIAHNSEDTTRVFEGKVHKNKQKRYKCRYAIIEPTYVCFFDETKHSIKTNWKGDSGLPIVFFLGNSEIQLSSTVLYGFYDAVTAAQKKVLVCAEKSSILPTSEYFIACPTYMSQLFPNTYADCQPVVTGKCIHGLDPIYCSAKELSEELGIVPVHVDKLELVDYRHGIVLNDKHKTICDIFTYVIDICHCVPYVHSSETELIPITDNYRKRVQVLVYGKFSDFESCMSNVRHRRMSLDLNTIGAVRLVPLDALEVVYDDVFSRRRSASV